jgi:hypothetical protein
MHLKIAQRRQSHLHPCFPCSILTRKFCTGTLLILLFLFVVQGFSCRNLRFADSSDEVVEEEPKAEEPTPSVGKSAKGARQRGSRSGVAKNVIGGGENQTPQDLTQPDLSLEKHQAAPSLNDASTLLCYLLELCYATSLGLFLYYSLLYRGFWHLAQSVCRLRWLPMNYKVNHFLLHCDVDEILE